MSETLQTHRMASTAPTSSDYVDLDSLLADTDRCVKCALCLPGCPTWAVERTETRSPRGRVALVQGMAAGRIAPAEAADALESCLSCRACEQVCPANVPYGAILDRGRALIAQETPQPTERRMAALLRSPRILRLLWAVHGLVQWLPLPRSLARLRAMPGLRQTVPAPISDRDHLGEVVVLEGCLTEAFDHAGGDGLAALLACCGFRVRRVSGCCAALSQHSGDLATARKVTSRLMAQIPVGDSPIVHVASGCAMAIRDLAQLHGTNDARAITARVVDPFDLVARNKPEEFLRPDATQEKAVALHLPCTMHSAGSGKALTAMLEALPGVRLVTCGGHGCCGAAGTHMLTRPDAAATLGEAVLDSLEGEGNIDVLLSANIGCAWHLRALLHDRKSTLEVMHPATYLARLIVR